MLDITSFRKNSKHFVVAIVEQTEERQREIQCASFIHSHKYPFSLHPHFKDPHLAKYSVAMFSSLCLCNKPKFVA